MGLHEVELNNNGAQQLSWLSVRLGIEGLLVRDLRKSLCCVEQNNLSTAYYWFKPGKQEIILTCQA